VGGAWTTERNTMLEGIKSYIIEIFLTISVLIGAIKLIAMEWRGLVEIFSVKKESQRKSD
jgi:hypothetical protein